MPKFPRIRLVWNSPVYFRFAGLYLVVDSKRYRILKVGKE